MIWLLVLLLLIPSVVSAQELLLAQATPPRLEWSMGPAPTSCTLATPSVTVRTRTSATSSTYTTVATLPIASTMTFNLPLTANNLYYTVRTACGTSNEVQYVAVVTPPPPTTGPTQAQFDALAARVSAVENRNTAQDTAISAVETKNSAQDVAIGVATTRIIAVESRASQVETKNVSQDATISALSARLAALEAAGPPPVPTANIEAKVLNADQIEITGLNCARLSTAGSGLKRIVTCGH